MLLKGDETRSGGLEAKRRKQFWKQCAIKEQSSPLKALLWVLKGSSGLKNNWVDSQNRSSPSQREKPLQSHAPTQSPLFRNFRTCNVPPALRCLHKSGFPVRNFQAASHATEALSRTWCDRAPPQGCIYPGSVHCHCSKGRQGWNIRGCCSLQSRNPVISQEKPPLVPADHRLPPLSHELWHLLHSQNSVTWGQTTATHHLETKGLTVLWPGDTDITWGEGWERSPSAAVNWVNISFCVCYSDKDNEKGRSRKCNHLCMHWKM